MKKKMKLMYLNTKYLSNNSNKHKNLVDEIPKNKVIE